MLPAPTKNLTWAIVAAGAFAALWFAHRGRHADWSSAEPLILAHKLTLQEVKTICATAPVSTEAENTPALPLTISGSAALEEQVELSQLATSRQLELTAEQLKVFATITNTIQAARRRYEASIAKVLPPRDDRLEMIVPMYSQVGDDLRSLYYQQLKQQLGPTVAQQIQQTLGADLETLFADFGSAEQGLEVAVAKMPSGPEYTVNSTAVFLTASSTNESYAIHRETHLLPMEDPSGATWADFVRLFASQS